MKKWSNVEEFRSIELDVRSEEANILDIVYALNAEYNGYDGVISNEYESHLNAPKDAARIDVRGIKTCGDAIMALSNVLNINVWELENQLPITLIDVGGTDECHYLKMDQIIWVIYSIEETKIIDPTFWINIENLATPSITGDSKQYKFSNRFQTLKSLKDRISSDPAQYSLKYGRIVNDFFMRQQLKRRHQLMALADIKISIEAGKYNIHAMDHYIGWEMFYLNNIINSIDTVAIEQYNRNYKNDIVEFPEDRKYSLLEIINKLGVDNCTSIKRSLEEYYGYHLGVFISDLKKAEKECQ